jgi:hypothetical protein
VFNIGDWVGRQDESIGNPLDLPLFWLDNIFKKYFKKLSMVMCDYDLPSWMVSSLRIMQT